MNVDALEYTGWLNNPIVDILYELGSTGIWTPRKYATDGSVWKDLRGLMTLNQAAPAKVTVQDPSTLSTTGLYQAQRRIGVLDVTTDGAGMHLSKRIVQ